MGYSLAEATQYMDAIGRAEKEAHRDAAFAARMAQMDSKTFDKAWKTL